MSVPLTRAGQTGFNGEGGRSDKNRSPPPPDRAMAQLIVRDKAGKGGPASYRVP